MPRVKARLLVLASCVAGLACGSAPPPYDGPPNVVLIIGDDHGYADFGFMGSEVVKTPRLDQLSAEGATFRLGYSTASVCRPALRTLLTGLEPYQYRLHEKAIGGMKDPFAAAKVIASLPTLPRLLAERGYASFEAGKYAEGSYASGGFTEGMVTGLVPVMEEGSLLVRQTMDPVFDFVDRHQREPFFLWFAPKLPHLPHNAPPEFASIYDGAALDPSASRYYAAISWFDHSVGRLVDHIEGLGLGSRTLFVYVVDNGWDPRDDGPHYGLLGGTRGKKSLFDLGFRTPVLLRWTGRIEPGRVSDELVSILDVFPTVLDYAGLETPPEPVGLSLRPLVEGTASAWPRKAFIGWIPNVRGDEPNRLQGGHYWRDARWRYVAPAQGPPALYDLEADPDERTDVSVEHTDIMQRAQAAIIEWGWELDRRAREKS